jgi:hypothetical protein
MFSRQDWKGMSVEQRLESLQGVETRAAVAQGRPAATVIAKDFPPPNPDGSYTAGAYNYGFNEYGNRTNEIYINRDDIRSDYPDAALDSVYHEGWHANQIFNEGYDPDAEGYITPEDDLQGYRDQSAEVEARDQAQSKLDDYTQNESQFHSGLYDNAPPQNKGIESFRQKSAENQNADQSQNKGIEAFRDKTENAQDAAQTGENKGIEAYREKMAEKEEAEQKAETEQGAEEEKKEAEQESENQEGEDSGQDSGEDAGQDSGEDAGQDSGEDAGQDSGEDAGQDSGEDAGQDSGEDAGQDSGEDAGQDSGEDAGQDSGEDAGQDSGEDAGQDSGEDSEIGRAHV